MIEREIQKPVVSVDGDLDVVGAIPQCEGAVATVGRSVVDPFDLRGGGLILVDRAGSLLGELAVLVAGSERGQRADCHRSTGFVQVERDDLA